MIDHPDPDGQTRKNKTLEKKCFPTHLTYEEMSRFNYSFITICLYDTFSADFISLDMTKWVENVSHSVGSSGSIRNYVQSIRQILFRGISKADSFPRKKDSFQPKTQPSEHKWAALHSQYEKRCFSERSLRAGQYCQTCFATRKDNFFPPMIMMLDESTQGLKLGTAINTLQLTVALQLGRCIFYILCR